MPFAQQVPSVWGLGLVEIPNWPVDLTLDTPCSEAGEPPFGQPNPRYGDSFTAWGMGAGLGEEEHPRSVLLFYQLGQTGIMEFDNTEKALKGILKMKISLTVSKIYPFSVQFCKLLNASVVCCCYCFSC